MGSDDANEGDGDGECVEHVWQLQAATLNADGAYLEKRCVRCPAVVMTRPGPARA